MSMAYAWRPLAILPNLKGSVCTDTGEEWLQHRLLELYHRSMDHIIQDINDLCSRDIYLRFADDRMHCISTFFLHLSWMVWRWLLHCCVMSINAPCAHVPAVSLIELNSQFVQSTLRRTVRSRNCTGTR